MTTPHALRDLAALIENLDDATLSIDGVETPDGSLVDGRSLTAELTVRLDWNDLDDVGSAVSVGLPDGSEAETDESGLAFPLAVELDVGDGTASTESAAESAETAKTQVTDGGVAMVRSDGPAESDPDRGAGTDATEDAERTDGAEADDETDAADSSDETLTTERDDETGVTEDDEEVGATERHEEAGTTERDEEVGATEHDEQSDTGKSTETSAETDTDEDAEADAAPEPHRDPRRLREAYESCDTFPEMAEALGASVTPQTVRYHAIELGIHRPNERPGSTGQTEVESAGDESSSAAPETESPAEATGAEGETGGGEATAAVEATGAADTESPEQAEDASTETADDAAESRPPELRTEDLPADVDLPSHVTLADLRDAVRDATTLYEVQRDLRVDRSAARRLLRDLNLLDLVTGRAATAEERSVSAANIDERIRRACT